MANIIQNGSFDPPAGQWTILNQWSLDTPFAHRTANELSGTSMLTNGDFNGSSAGWTVGANWSYGGNNMVHSPGDTDTLSQNMPSILSGLTYRLTFNVGTLSDGVLTLYQDATPIQSFSSPNGDQTLYFTSESDASDFIISPDAAWSGTVTNFFIYEVLDPTLDPLYQFNVFPEERTTYHFHADLSFLAGQVEIYFNGELIASAQDTGPVDAYIYVETINDTVFTIVPVDYSADLTVTNVSLISVGTVSQEVSGLEEGVEYEVVVNWTSDMGPDIIINGGFVGSTDEWDLGSSWAYGDNNIVHTPGEGVPTSQTNGDIVAGATYEITYNITGTTGYVNVAITESDAGQFNAGSGDVSFISTAIGGVIYIVPSDTFDGAVTNITMRRTNPGSFKVRQGSQVILDTD